MDDEEVILTGKEYEVLVFLAEHPNEVFSKEDLFKKVWDMDPYGDTAVVTVYIRKIREKIEYDKTNPQYIETIWGVGYRFNV